MKAALFKPRLYFDRGYWRVIVPGRREGAPWKCLRDEDKCRITAAYTQVAKLNASPEALALRTLYYKNMGRAKKATRTGPEYHAAIMASFYSNRAALSLAISAWAASYCR